MPAASTPVLRAVTSAAGSVPAAEAQLHAPSQRAGSVHRTALVNRLRTHEAPVVVLSAPAGYGKSTLLAQWSKRDARPFAWISLQPGDGEPDLLPHLVLGAFSRAAPGDTVLAELLASPVHLERRLASWLRARSEPIVLVVDDVDRLDHRRCADFLALLGDHLPGGSQLVLSGRTKPDVHLGRLRAEGRLLELAAGDVRLTEREALALLREAGVDVTAGEADELNRRAEGWAAGVFLTGLALRPQRGRRLRSTDSMRGAHHFVTDYLDSEVLGRLPEDDVAFLLESSVLDRMSGRVCDTVRGADGSARRLRRLDAAGAFVVPLDRERTSFRFHDFFRDALRTRLEQELPARYTELSRRAAAWFEGEGDIPSAIGHLRAIGDRAEAARLLGATIPEICGRGLLGRIDESIADLRDEALLHEYQPAAVAGAFAHAFAGDAAETERCAAIAEAAPARMKMRDGTASSATWARLLRATLCRDGMDQMRKDAAIAFSRLGNASLLAPYAIFLAAVGQLHSGKRAEAETSFADAADRANAAEATLVETMALAQLSLLAHEKEDWHGAESLATQARDAAERLEEGHVGAALAYVASVRSALRNSNWVRAGDDIDVLQQLLPHLGESLPWLAVQVRLELARAELALNDVAAADELTTEAEHIVLRRPFLGALVEETHALRERVREVRQGGSAVGATLTTAELRLLPLLTTHLTFRQIAQHLYVSRNTIKTQAISVYRKLGVTSRNEAVDRAAELGLIRPDDELGEHPA